MKDEKDKFKELQRKNQELEAALEKARLQAFMYECLLESVEAHYQIDLKKALGPKVPDLGSSMLDKTDQNVRSSGQDK
jgi:hypothetical protein